MRRVLVFALAVVLFLAPPLALADGKGKAQPPLVRLGSPPPPPAAQSLPPAPAPVPSPPSAPTAVEPSAPALADSAASSSSGGVPIGVLSLGLMGVGGALTLLLSFFAARRARRPKPARAPRRSFEAGRALGLASRVGSLPEALFAVQHPAVGELASLHEVGGSVRVALKRRRSEPCEYAAGYVTGLFESAWAADAVLRHDACAGARRGGVCVYELRPSGAVSSSAAPAAAASIPGSRGASGRWPPARRGGA